MNTLCDLHFATGTQEECPRAGCAFWEDGGCAFEPVRFEFEGRPDVALLLLEMRRELESARGIEPAGASGRLQAFLPPGLRD